MKNYEAPAFIKIDFLTEEILGESMPPIIDSGDTGGSGADLGKIPLPF